MMLVFDECRHHCPSKIEKNHVAGDVSFEDSLLNYGNGVSDPSHCYTVTEMTCVGTISVFD